MSREKNIQSDGMAACDDSGGLMFKYHHHCLYE